MINKIFDYFGNVGQKFYRLPEPFYVTIGLITLVVATTCGLLTPVFLFDVLLGSGKFDFMGVVAAIIALGFWGAILYNPLNKFVQFLTYGQHFLTQRNSDELFDLLVGYTLVTLGSIAIPSVIIGLLMHSFVTTIMILAVCGLLVGLSLIVRKVFEFRVRMEQHVNNANAHRDKNDTQKENV